MDTVLNDIFAFIFDPLKSVLIGGIGLLPSLTFPFDVTSFLVWFSNLVDAAAFFLPIYDLLMLFSVYFAIANFHIIWKIIQRIWDAIPFV